MTTNELLLNQFRSADAFEYVEAYKRAIGKTPDEIKEMMFNLDSRIRKITPENESPLPYLLAAYRGYEDALTFKTMPVAAARAWGTHIVTLNQSKEFEQEIKRL